MRTITKEELLKSRDGGRLTVGQLKQFIAENEISDDAIVVVERVEDQYYEGGVDISGIASFTENGFVESLPEGSRSTEWGVYVKKRDGFPVQYHAAWQSPIYFDDKKDILFIDLHY